MSLRIPIINFDKPGNLIPPKFRLPLTPIAAETIDISSAAATLGRLLTKLGVLQIAWDTLGTSELKDATSLLLQEFEVELKSLAEILQRTIIVIPEFISSTDPEDAECAADLITFCDDDEEDGYAVYHFTSKTNDLE